MNDNKRKLGRPRIYALAMTPAQRAKRYRDKKRDGIVQAAYGILALMAAEAAGPFSRKEYEAWQRSLIAEADQINKDFWNWMDEAMAL